MDVIGQFQMTKDDSTTTHRAMRTDFGAAGHPDTTGHGRVFTYVDIVSDLNQVIELDAIFNHRVFDGATVHAGICTDLNFVAYAYTAELFYLYPLPFVKRKAETIGTDHHAWVKNAVLTNHTTGRNSHSGRQPTARSYACAVFDHTQWSYAGCRMYDSGL